MTELEEAGLAVGDICVVRAGDEDFEVGTRVRIVRDEGDNLPVVKRLDEEEQMSSYCFISALTKESEVKPVVTANPAVTPKQAYCALQEASGLKAGDIVKVTRTAKHNELGWANGWVDGMEWVIGKEFTIKSLNSLGVTIDDRDGYSYPFFVLELVESAPIVHKSIRIKGWHFKLTLKEIEELEQQLEEIK